MQRIAIHPRKSLAVLAIAVAGLLVAVGAASAQDWTVTKVRGSAWIVVGQASPVALETGTALPPGSTVRTESRSRVLIERDMEAITVGPAASITLPAGPSSNGITTVLQKKGEVKFDIETRNKPHFAVRTPFLAALVKGTQFTVAINTGSSSVSVHDGLVQVTNLFGGKSADVSSGQSATVSRRGGGDIKISLSTFWRTGSQNSAGRLAKIADESGEQASGFLRTALSAHPSGPSGSGTDPSDASGGSTQTAGGPDRGALGIADPSLAVFNQPKIEREYGNFFADLLDGDFELTADNAEGAIAAGAAIFAFHFVGVGVYRRIRRRKGVRRRRRSLAPRPKPRDADDDSTEPEEKTPDTTG